METFLTVILILVGALAINYIASSIVNKKQEKLFSEISSTEANVQSKCMVAQGGIEAPGIAQVKDGKLIVYNVLGKRFEVPLDEVSVTKECLGLGKLGWFGKRVFKLHSRQTVPFALGISRSEAHLWRKALHVEK
jgi:hypothetical protein